MSFIAAAIVGSAVIGAAVSISANNKSIAAQNSANKQQKLEALQAAKLKRIKEDAGAKIKVGSVDTGLERSSASKGRATGARTVSGNSIGGVSASQVGGL